MVVPFPAGGPAERSRASWPSGCAHRSARPVMVENVAGAGGSIGVGRVARAAPDGYTFGMGQWSTHVVNPVIIRCRTTC